MKVIYNITDRKPFVKALEEITGAKAVYMKTPTYAYTVDYTVNHSKLIDSPNCRCRAGVYQFSWTCRK